MSKPLVSVIVPTYNYGHYIEETLASIEAQSFQDWECIVVDNGSTDDTKVIAQKWIDRDSRFRYIAIAHGTISKCRNAGLAEFRGDFIQFVDADDQIATGKLENQLRLFNAHKEASIVYSHARYYDHGNPSVLRLNMHEGQGKWMVEFSGKSWDLLPKMFEKNVFVISSPLLKRNVIDDTKGFYEGLNWVEDWDFYFRCLAQNYDVIYDSAESSFSFIRVHPTSLSRNKTMMLEQSLIARTRVKSILEHLTGYKNGPALMAENNRFVKYLHRLLVNEYAQKNPSRSRKHLFQFALMDRDYKLVLKTLLLFLTQKTMTLPEE
jgi:glycosyltransferase involved in cell wall biosynthesis